MEEYHTLERLSEELRAVEKTLTQLFKAKEEEPGYWSRVAKKVDKVFLIFYITVISAFLVVMFFEWNSAEGESLLDGSV